MILKVGSKNVARRNGCFCRLLSDIGAGTPPVSGSGIVLDDMGEIEGVEVADGEGEPATKRLKPIPSRPDRALRVPPTVALID